MSAWIRPDSSSTSRGWIAGEGDNYGLAVNRFNPDDLLFYFYNGSAWVFDNVSNAGINDDKWHHVAATFDQSTGLIRLYVDTIEVSSNTVTGSIAYLKGSGFRIGSMTGQRNFKGDLDDIRVYQRALSETEITTISQINQPSTNTAPVVNAGSDQSIQLPTDSLQLSSTISDDGLPSNSLTFSWTQQSGPGTAIIVPGNLSGNALSTTVTLDVVGVYVLRLTATDGSLSTFDDVQIT